MKKVLITGITGQDGSYLAEYLLPLGYEVHGIVRKASIFNTQRIDHLYTDPHLPDIRLFLHHRDLSDSGRIQKLILSIKPDENYNLGAQSHVHVSFDMPEYTADITGIAPTRMLEAIRHSGLKTKMYQASSSEMFGNSPPPQNETTPLRPRSPYAVAKTYAYWTTLNYREAYNIFVCNGILFNHESPRRGETFVTRKITRAVACIKLRLQEKLYLGNLEARRNWGYAGDYVKAMWLMLQQDEPDDYIIAAGESHSIKDFLKEAFGYLEMNWEDYVETDPRYFRPTEVNHLLGDATKAKKKLGWEPTVDFKELVRMMVDDDLKEITDTRELAADEN